MPVSKRGPSETLEPTPFTAKPLGCSCCAKNARLGEVTRRSIISALRAIRPDLIVVESGTRRVLPCQTQFLAQRRYKIEIRCGFSGQETGA